MAIPSNLRYTHDHEWARDEGDGTCTVGVTDFAQENLGGVVYVELPAVGTAVKAGARFGTVESTKSVSELYAPVAGRVVAVNEALQGEPELVNSDAFGQGWMVRIQVEAADALAGLMDGTGYEAHVAAAAH
ncbi:MAG: glycine cleavage system protein GcvH [Deltaproteobacteria bacterium]|nr:glycine cleavage system protein GcvH [Deltaproteobacteria bacterium]